MVKTHPRPLQGGELLGITNCELCIHKKPPFNPKWIIYLIEKVWLTIDGDMTYHLLFGEPAKYIFNFSSLYDLEGEIY